MTNPRDFSVGANAWASSAEQWIANPDRQNQSDLIDILRACLVCCRNAHAHLQTLTTAKEIADFSDTIDVLVEGAGSLVQAIRGAFATLPHPVASDVSSVELCLQSFREILRSKQTTESEILRQRRPVGLRQMNLDRPTVQQLDEMLSRPPKKFREAIEPIPEGDRDALLRKLSG
jgi:hypothetical protein